MKKGFVAIFFTYISLITVAMAEGSGTEQLNRFVQSVGRFQAKFQQTVIDPQGQVLQEAQGSFQLQRPGKFRWDYQAPYPQQIVADGTRIWFYDMDLEQVTVKSQVDALADTPASLLSGDIMPEETYLLTDVPSADGLTWVELQPRDVESSFKSIVFAFSGDQLTQMIMQDSFDQKTRLTFSQVKTNLDFDQSIFQFTPPEGVDVVGDKL